MSPLYNLNIGGAVIADTAADACALGIVDIDDITSLAFAFNPFYAGSQQAAVLFFNGGSGSGIYEKLASNAQSAQHPALAALQF